MEDRKQRLEEIIALLRANIDNVNSLTVVAFMKDGSSFCPHAGHSGDLFAASLLMQKICLSHFGDIAPAQEIPQTPSLKIVPPPTE